MSKVRIEKMKVEDAQRLYEILNTDNFTYFDVRPESVKDEEEYIKDTIEKSKINFMHNYTIYFENEIVGAIGLRIDQHHDFIGEIGYFVDENYWGKGIATSAVKILEEIGFNEYNLQRIVIMMNVEHEVSERVAIKAGYEKEGIARKSMKTFGKFYDCYTYSKVKN